MREQTGNEYRDHVCWLYLDNDYSHYRTLLSLIDSGRSPIYAVNYLWDIRLRGVRIDGYRLPKYIVKEWVHYHYNETKRCKQEACQC